MKDGDKVQGKQAGVRVVRAQERSAKGDERLAEKPVWAAAESDPGEHVGVCAQGGLGVAGSLDRRAGTSVAERTDASSGPGAEGGEVLTAAQAGRRRAPPRMPGIARKAVTRIPVRQANHRLAFWSRLSMQAPSS